MMNNNKVTTFKLREMMARGEKITVLTCYDYSMAKMLDQAGIEILLVGDSLGNVLLGYDSTIPVNMEDMLIHTKAVSRGLKMLWWLQICLLCHTRFR